MSSPTPRVLIPVVVAVALLLAGCGVAGPSTPGTEPDPVPPVEETACPEPLAGVFGGPAVALDDAQILGADDLPADVCAYGSESGDSIWIIAEPYDAGFPATVAEWLEGYGWSSEELGTWGEGDLQNLGFTPPAGIEITSAFAHAFSAYPESVSFNMGIDQEFLTHCGLEPGDELAIFAAWR